MDHDATPPGGDDPFVVNRVPDAELEVSVPFELEASEWDWELHRSAAGAEESWGAAGDYGIE